MGAVRVLEAHGGTVYIDKKDAALPPYTSKKTAGILKDRIRQSSKFVLLASANSKESKWVPWELGYADGTKGIDRIAVFPVVEMQSASAWTHWEYIGLYDRIVWGDLKGYPKKVWMVLDETDNTATELRRWLTGS